MDMHQKVLARPAVDGDTPTIRLFGLLEVIAAKDGLFTLPELVAETGIPKPSLHRMLAQLESAGLLQREGDGRRYGTGARLRRLAENLLVNSLHGARHAVLRRLVDRVGESCNLTALSGSEVVYLDRVETPAPLRFYLQPGSRVPVHCSASGKLFLSQLAPAALQRMLGAGPYERFTPNTLVDRAALMQELAQVRSDGYALDREEFLPGLLCAAVPVPDSQGRRANLALAIQGPTQRLSEAKACQLLPALQEAAAALARIDTTDPSDTKAIE